MVASGGPKHWRLIAARLVGRTARQCRERWVNYLSPLVTQCAWTADEENLLLEKVTEFGKQWSRIATFFDGRTDVSLKNRYLKLLRRERMTERRARKAAARIAKSESPRTHTTAALSNEEVGTCWLNDARGYDTYGWGFDAFDAKLSGEFS
jgi:hypothetical protein